MAVGVVSPRRSTKPARPGTQLHAAMAAPGGSSGLPPQAAAMPFPPPPVRPFPFPYAQPYDIQSRFMAELYGTIKTRRMGVFESPTGTVRVGALAG